MRAGPRAAAGGDGDGGRECVGPRAGSGSIQESKFNSAASFIILFSLQLAKNFSTLDKVLLDNAGHMISFAGDFTPGGVDADV